jgi:hypothetical protein
MIARILFVLSIYYPNDNEPWAYRVDEAITKLVEEWQTMHKWSSTFAPQGRCPANRHRCRMTVSLQEKDIRSIGFLCSSGLDLHILNYAKNRRT